MTPSALCRMFTLLLLALLFGCRNEREHEKNMLADLTAIQEAINTHQEIPPLSEDPHRYGRGVEIMRFCHERAVRLAVLQPEFTALLKESTTWVTPREWSDRTKLKATRAKAERLLVVIRNMESIQEDFFGERFHQSVLAFKLGPRFEQGYRDAMGQETELIEASRALMTAVRLWAEKGVELFTLVDEKLVTMDEELPKFAEASDAEAYRRLLRETHELWAGLREPVMHFQDALAKRLEHAKDS